MQMTGHKTRAVFERYNIVSEGDLADAARKLDAVRSRDGRNSGHREPLTRGHSRASGVTGG